MLAVRITDKSTLSATLAALLLSTLPFQLSADDKEAEASMAEAKAEFADGDYRAAGKAYLAADLLADSPEIKLEALKRAADAFDKADFQYERYKCVKKMIDGFADRIDFAKAVETEYEIANKFAKGHRDMAVSWLPWITGPNKSLEIYEAILEQAPFAKFAPRLRLRLGRMQLENGENQKALKTFREVIKKHPGTEEAKFARFELANALKQMAGRAGDGDGRYTREADAVLKETLKLYPKSPETQWIKESLSKTEELKAERLYEWATFYDSRDNPEAAVRYYNDLLARYPRCEYRAKAVKRLAELDPDNPPPPPPPEEKDSNPYPIGDMVYEKEVILVPPEASGGKWLLPIPDLDLNSERADAEHAALKAAEAEKRRRAKEKADALKRAREAAKKKHEAELAAKKKTEEAQKAAEKKIAAENTEKKAAKAAEKADRVVAGITGGNGGAATTPSKAKPHKPAGAKPADKPTEKKKPASKPVAEKKQDAEKQASAEAADSGGWTSAIIPAALLLLLAIVAVIYFASRKKRGESS